LHDYGFVQNWGATPAARVHGPQLDRCEEHRDQCNSGDRDYNKRLDLALQTDSTYHRQFDDNNRIGLERSKPSDGHVLEGIYLNKHSRRIVIGQFAVRELACIRDRPLVPDQG